ncbi:ion channel [Glaciihabitans sp. dw_435]|uniref:ion channel n=1 Tax=Glaciihabitans sp. dw_435 TaxID=2720081 RepID=UPI001BD3AAE8|nr:ion channel [Glaciihabitans sp. dw_435]
MTLGDTPGRTSAGVPAAWQDRLAARHPHSQSGYWVVLLLIAVSYVLCATQASPDPSAPALLVQLATVAVTLWVAHVGPVLRRTGWIVLAVAAVAIIAVRLAGTEGHVLDIALSAASMLAYLSAPVAILSHQIRRGRVDGQTLLAAVAAYVLVGMFFTFVFNLTALVTDVPIFGDAHADTLTSQLFFSFTTLTTTGYGNLVPVGQFGQTVAIVEAIAGQLFLVIAVARVVAGWERPRP